MKKNNRIAPFIRTYELAEREHEFAVNRLLEATNELMRAVEEMKNVNGNVDSNHRGDPRDNCTGDDCFQGVPSGGGKGDA